MSGINSEFDLLMGDQFETKSQARLMRKMRLIAANEFSETVKALFKSSVEGSEQQLALFSIPLAEGEMTVAIDDSDKLTRRPGMVVITNRSRWAQGDEPSAPLGRTIETTTTLLPWFSRRRPVIISGNFFLDEGGEHIKQDFYASRILQESSDTALVQGYLAKKPRSRLPIAGSQQLDMDEIVLFDSLTEVMAKCTPHFLDPNIIEIRKQPPQKPHP